MFFILTYSLFIHSTSVSLHFWFHMHYNFSTKLIFVGINEMLLQKNTEIHTNQSSMFTLRLIKHHGTERVSGWSQSSDFPYLCQSSPSLFSHQVYIQFYRIDMPDVYDDNKRIDPADEASSTCGVFDEIK